MAVAAATLASSGPDDGLGRAAIASGLLHIALLVVAIFGLPQLIKPLPTEDRPLIVEALPLSSITNAPPPASLPTPQVQQAQRPQPPEPPRPQPQVTPPPPAPAPAPQAQTPPPAPAPPPAPVPPTPAASAPTPPAQATPIPPPPAPPQPTPRPAEAPSPLPLPPPPAPPAPPPPAPAVAAAPPQPAAPPPPPPAQPQQRTQTPPQPARQQQAFSLDNVLNDVRRRPPPQQQQQAAAPAAPAAARPSAAPNNPLLPLSMTEEDAIRQRVVGNWNVDVGAKGIESFVVTLKVFLTADGSVQRVDILETQGSPAEPLRAFAEGARRATLRSSPLPIPAARAQQLVNGNLELRFSAREMLGMR